jgi:hypothetical protein
MSAADATANTDEVQIDYANLGRLAVDETTHGSSTFCGRLWKSCTTKLRTYRKVTQAVLGGGSFIAATILRSTVYQISKATPIGSTLTAFGVGAGFHTFLDAVLPTEIRIIIDQLNKDNAFKVWFILTQLFFYYNETDAARKELILATLTSYVGAVTAAKIFDLIRKKAVDIPQSLSLTDDQVNSEVRAPILPEPHSKGALAIYTTVKVAAGVATIGIFRNHPIGIPLGTFILSDASGFVAGERLQARNVQLSPNMRSLSYVGFVMLESTWGLVIGLAPGSPLAFVYGGLATGFTKFYRKKDAEEIPPNSESQRRPIVSLINRVTDAAFIGFFIWWLERNFSQSQYLGERVALGTCAAVLPTVMITKIFLNRCFKWGKHNRIVNSINFYLQDYTVPASLLFAFVELYNGMGSRVLRRGDIVTSEVVPAIGWFGYMTALATSTTTSQPCSSLGLDGLTAGFIADQLQNKL